MDFRYRVLGDLKEYFSVLKGKRGYNKDTFFFVIQNKLTYVQMQTQLYQKLNASLRNHIDAPCGLKADKMIFFHCLAQNIHLVVAI